MSANVTEIITAQLLPSTAAELYPSPISTTTRIDKLSVSNPGTSTCAVTIYLVPSGASPGVSNVTTSAQGVAPGATFNSPNEYGHYLNPGDAIWAFASTASQLVILAGGTQVVS